VKGVRTPGRRRKTGGGNSGKISQYTRLIETNQKKHMAISDGKGKKEKEEAH